MTDVCCFFMSGCDRPATERFIPDDGFPVHVCGQHADAYRAFMDRMSPTRKPRGRWESIPSAASDTAQSGA